MQLTKARDRSLSKDFEMNPFEPDELDPSYRPPIQRPFSPTSKDEEKKESSDLPLFLVIGAILVILMVFGSAF